MNVIIITNNPKICEKYNNIYQIIFIDGGYLDVLIKARDFIHKGHQLLTHPLSGSIKPNETPYKSIMISGDSDTLKMDELLIIESSIDTARKFIANKKTPKWTESVLQDFREIDYRLLESAIGSIVK